MTDECCLGPPRLLKRSLNRRLITVGRRRECNTEVWVLSCSDGHALPLGLDSLNGVIGDAAQFGDQALQHDPANASGLLHRHIPQPGGSGDVRRRQLYRGRLADAPYITGGEGPHDVMTAPFVSEVGNATEARLLLGSDARPLTAQRIF